MKNETFYQLSDEVLTELLGMLEKKELENAKKLINQYKLFMQAYDILNSLIER